MKRPYIRPATGSDVAAINAIYNHYILHSTCTWLTEPEAVETRRAWFDAHGLLHPVLVAECDGEITAWGALSAFKPVAAYEGTVEDSVYIRPDFQRRGIGRALLAELIDRGRAAGHHSILASISADQLPSIRLHESLGFCTAAHFREVGRKTTAWLDLLYMQLLL
jgi:L-amino acid N-acyltransferase